MTTQVADGYISNGARFVGEMQTALEAWQSIMEETLGGSVDVGLTLASDIALVPNDAMSFTIDTETFLATDNLMNLNGVSPGVLRDGHFVLIRNFNTGRAVVVKHGTGNIQLLSGADLTLTDTKTYLGLINRGGTWYEVFRGDTLFIRQLVGALQETTLTIATGSVTATQGIHEVDTEAAAPTDDLTNIVQTSMLTAMVLIHSVAAARVITVKNSAGGAGQIITADLLDIVLDDPDKFLWLMRKGTTWEEVGRFGFPALGSHLRTVVSAGASSNALAGFRTYIIDTVAIAGNHTLDLPNIAGAANSRITVKVLGDFAVTLDGQGAQQVEGAATRILQGDGAEVTLVEDGTQWRFIA